MGTEILKSFGTLQLELEQARTNLRGVDEHIKRLIGRDPSEIVGRNAPGGPKRQSQNEENRTKQRALAAANRRGFNHENDEPPNKRRNNTSVFKRLSERPSHYEEELEQKPPRQMISKVIVTPKEIPSRQEALAAQSCDEKFKARNKRMFGALLGTLQKFQQEETKLKPKEEKRAQLEKKIEEHEIREKAEIRKERQELFLNRKKKQAEIKMIELKMIRMKDYAVWEERQKPRMNFIQTKAKPHVHYLPRKLNDANRAELEQSKVEIEKMIDAKRQEVFDELQHIEDRMRKNFEPRKNREEKQAAEEETNADESALTNEGENTNPAEEKTNGKEEQPACENCPDDEEEEDTAAKHQESAQEETRAEENPVQKPEEEESRDDVAAESSNELDVQTKSGD